MGKKIILSHKEVEVKVLLEVFAVYVILVLVLAGLYYFEPTITGFAAAAKECDQSDWVNLQFNDSEEIISTMLSLVIILILSSLLYNFVSYKGKNKSKLFKKVGKIRRESKKFQENKQRQLKLKKKERIKAKKEIKRQREGKSHKYVKCHKLLLIADKAWQNNNIPKAKKLYLKSRGLYTKLEYLEKKEICDELTMLYNKLSMD